MDKWCEHWVWDKQGKYFIENVATYPKRIAGAPFELIPYCPKCGEARPIYKRKLWEVLSDEGYRDAKRIVEIVNNYSAGKYSE